MKRVQINRDKSEVVVNLDTNFYPYEDIIESVQIFSESCLVNVEGDAQSIVQVSLKPKSESIKLDELGYEFYNYVLGVIKNRK